MGEIRGEVKKGELSRKIGKYRKMNGEKESFRFIDKTILSKAAYVVVGNIVLYHEPECA